MHPLVATAYASIPTAFANEGEVLTRINTVASWIFAVLLIVAVIYIILAAFAYLTGGGSSEDVSKAHKKLIYAAVAVAVAVLSKGLVSVIAKIVSGKSDFTI